MTKHEPSQEYVRDVVEEFLYHLPKYTNLSELSFKATESFYWLALLYPDVLETIETLNRVKTAESWSKAFTQLIFLTELYEEYYSISFEEDWLTVEEMNRYHQG